MSPEQYKLKPEAYAAYRRNILIAIGPLFLTIAVPVFYYKLYNTDNKPTDWNQVGFIGALAVIFIIIRLFRLLKRQKKAYEEFVLIIDGEHISGQNLLMQPIDLSGFEVVEIVKNTDGNLLLRGGAKNEVIIIPSAIENKEQLEASLDKISTIRVNPVNFFTKYSKFIILAVFGTLIVFIYSSNKIIIGITGPVLDILFIWLFILLNKTKQTDPKTERIKWFILLPIIGILIKMYIVFSGHNLF